MSKKNKNTVEKMWKLQDKLDEMLVVCKLCSEPEPWGLHRKVGCLKEFEKWAKKGQKNDISE